MKSSAKNNLALALVLAAMLFVPSFAGCEGAKYRLPKEELFIHRADGSTLAVVAELAIKPEERNWGYMKRKNIPAGTGMLFVFEQDQVLRFWMKDTPHPLSIAYIDSAGVIRDIFDMTPFSLADVTSSRSVRYALEVPQGWYKENGICVGDRVTLKDGNPLKKLQG